MEKRKKRVRNILLVIVGIFLFFFCYIFFSIKVIGNDYVNIFGYTYFEVGSGSMNPTILKGDVVVVKIDDKYKVNDIITYRKKNNYVTHRVIDINDKDVIARGDANNTLDNVVDRKNIIGRVVFVMKRVGVWRKVFSNLGVVIALFVTIILFCLLLSYRDEFPKYRMRKIHYVKKRKKRVVNKKGK